MADRAADWQCPNQQCINHTGFPEHFVFGSKVNCSKCGTGKSAQRAGDWCCPNPACVNHQNTVYGSKGACSRCGTPRPMPGGAAPHPHASMMPGAMPVAGGRPGDWHCANPQCKNHRDNVVYSSKTSCPICGTAKPAAPQPAQMAFQLPPQLQQVTQAFAAAAAPQPRGRQGRPGDWHCPNETCKNHTDNFIFGSKSFCPLCGTEKPADWKPAATAAPPVMPGVMGVSPQGFGFAQRMPVAPPAPYAQPFQQMRASGRPGDWHCPNPGCKNFRDNVVYASKTVCPLCNTPKGNGETSMGPTLTHPGDWMCPNTSCKNHTNGVYGSKSACTICGEQRPDLEDGLRARSRSPH